MSYESPTEWTTVTRGVDSDIASVAEHDWILLITRSLNHGLLRSTLRRCRLRSKLTLPEADLPMERFEMVDLLLGLTFEFRRNGDRGKRERNNGMDRWIQ